jgi:dephospho-CoA kinase
MLGPSSSVLPTRLLTLKTVVGLTGGIASGKSTVSSLLQSSGIPIVDLDILARQAVEPGTRALKAIHAHFGDSVLNEDGTLNRDALGAIVFHDERQRKKLNSIVHPAIRRLMAREVVRHWLTGQPLCVVDAPLLIEAGLWRYCGKIVLVYWCAPASTS